MINIRPLEKNDLSFLLEVRNDFSTRNNLEDNSIFDIEQCENWFVKSNPKWFIIEHKNIKVGYFRTNGDEVGCDIHPDFRRNGFARMSYEYYLKHINSASLWVFEDNFAKNLYESLGFTPSGKTKKIRNRNYIHMVWNRA